MLAGEGLVTALRQGGYVIVMRQASSPREVPTKQTADAGNVKLERQLDEAGRAGSIAMGRALRDLRIPVGEVLTSPTYRARDCAPGPGTIRHAEGRSSLRVWQESLSSRRSPASIIPTNWPSILERASGPTGFFPPLAPAAS